jgi:hypothetical protein
LIDEMSKIVEKFAYLKDLGEGLLHRLYYARFYFSNDKCRPQWLKDPASQKVLRSLLAKFPEFPDTDKVFFFKIPHKTRLLM